MKNNKENVRLSFIIPVYNVEKYLNECVDSIRNQMTDYCEIILVNDGSTDLSGDICREYSRVDTRIKVVDQENQGAAVARNRGLLSAQGEYVAFVDSDDRIALNSVESILSWIEFHECDVCFLQANKLYPNGILEDMGECMSREYIQGKSRAEVMSYLSTRPKFTGSACNKIYKRIFLIDNNLYFPEDGLVCEDLIFVRDVLLKGESFDFLDCPYYEYRQFRDGSVTNIVSYKHFQGNARFIEESSHIFTKNQQAHNNICESAMSFVSYEYSIILWQYNFLKREEKKAAYDWLKCYAWVLEYSKNKKCRIIHLCVRILGIKFTTKLLNLYMICLRSILR